MNAPGATHDKRALVKATFGSPSGFLAMGAGAGLAPMAPGTAGTALAVPLTPVLRMLGPAGFWVALILLFAVGVWCCGRASERLGVHDHGGIVWDEMVGYWLALALAPLHWQWLLAGFILFRLFDIFKPWPIGALDKRLGGGLGIMADDVVAGLYTLIVLAVLERLA